MKIFRKASFYTVPLIMVLMLSACDNRQDKHPSGSTADSFMERLITRIDRCKSAYDNFLIMIPDESNSLIRGMIKIGYTQMVESFAEEEENLEKINVWTKFSDEDIARSQKMKDLTADIISTYKDGADNELKEVRDLVNSGKPSGSQEVSTLINAFEEKLAASYSAFGAEQEKYAEVYDIILY